MISELYNWASAQVTSPVIWANQDGSQPSGAYSTLHVIATTREGLPHIGAPNVDGEAVIYQGQLFTLSINTYGGGALGDIQALRDSLEKITVQRDLRDSGFAYVRVLSGPQDIPEITGTTWQQRSQMDVQFRAAITIIDDIGVISTVATSGGNGTASDTGAIIGGA